MLRLQHLLRTQQRTNTTVTYQTPATGVQITCPAKVRSSVGTETIAQIVNAYELTISCEKCSAQSQQTIGWIRQHRDMKCPGCDAVIVLNTSRITRTIRSVERRLGDLQTQLTERIRKL
jgi:hypothetical protein